MIPTRTQALTLWDTYKLPPKKRVHTAWVTATALFLAKKIMEKDPSITINIELLEASALLHDIDKNVEKLPGEHHPESAVRIVRNEHMEEVADVIQYHSVQFIENEKTKPKSWEEKLLFLADKMVKYDVLTVDKRFALWLAEDDLPEDQKAMLRRVFPLVKALEKEIFTRIGMDPTTVVQYVRIPSEYKLA